MQTKLPATPATTKNINPDQAGLDHAIRDYVEAHQRLHGQKRTAETLGVSRHTLWRYLERRHAGRAVPAAVLDSVGSSIKDIEAATLEIIIDLEGLRPDPALRPLRRNLEDALLLLCAAPLTTVDELARFGRVPASTLRDRLEKLTKRGLVDTVSHHLGALGSRPQRRYFPTDKGITAAGAATEGREHMLMTYPLSRQWFRLLAERMDAVAVLYRVAAMIADADPKQDEVRVDHHRHGPYDLLATLSGGLTIGVIRQGPMLPTSNLRYRLRSIELLPSSERPFLTLIVTHADQATRRAVRSLGDPSERRRTFVTTEGELLAGDHTGEVWQQCGYGLGLDQPVGISPETSLAAILPWADGLLESSRQTRRGNPGPYADNLYSASVQATMPEPAEQLASALAIQLTRAEKDALDLVAAWPRCSREQLAGLMGGVTLRRVNQALRPLREHDLVQEDDALLMLTDRGLTYLARRDRAAVGLTLDRWTAQPAVSNPRVYAGSALRALASQPRHHCGVTSFAAALSAEVARSPDHDLFDLLPTHRSSIGYRRGRTNYAIHPDASFTLEYQGKWLPFLLEFERRATTPNRIPQRLASYRRYFASGWAERDHGGRTPAVLFVFETPESEAAFLDVSDGVEGLDVIIANGRPWESTASWARRGCCRRPTRWTGRRWPNCTRLHKCNPLCRAFPVEGLPHPGMDNFAATCRNLVPLPPRHCNMLQSRHARLPGQRRQRPPIRYAIQVRMPTRAAKPQTLTNQPSGPDSVSNRVSGAVPVVSNDAQKGSDYHSLVCVQQAARLRNVAGPDPEDALALGHRRSVSRC